MDNIEQYQNLANAIVIQACNDYKIGRPGSRHNTGSKSTNLNRKNRKGSQLSKADHNRLKNLI